MTPKKKHRKIFEGSIAGDKDTFPAIPPPKPPNGALAIVAVNKGKRKEKAVPINIPTPPPITPSKSDSVINMKRICLSLAPMALSVPISLVLSEIDVSIVFTTPKLPAIRASSPIERKNNRTVFKMFDICWMAAVGITALISGNKLVIFCEICETSFGSIHFTRIEVIRLCLPDMFCALSIGM